MIDPDRVPAAFAAVLRRAGVGVPTGSVLMFSTALAAVGLESPAAVYWAGRATLVRRPGDVAAYDRAFAAFWSNPDGEAILDGDDADTPPVVPALLDDGEEPPGATGDATVVDTLHVRYTAHETLRTKDFAAYSGEEFAEARRLMADLRLAGALRRSRRKMPGRGPHRQPDLRGTARASLRSGGEPVRRLFRVPAERRRPVVLLCDVSGSMEPYARAVMRFAHGAVSGRARVEVFTLGTRLTRVTRQLSTRDPDAALRSAASAVADWSGGTRLGETLKRFNDEWGVRGTARGAVVVVVSDGWDRGEAALLSAEMARLRRVAFRIVWVNPLKATAGYAPLAQGMAAALPYIDEFVEGHSLESLETLAAVVAGVAP